MEEVKNSPQLLQDNSIDLFNKGLQAYRLGDFVQSIEIFSEIAANNPDIVEAQVNLGNSFYRVGKTDDAIETWKSVLKKDKGNVNCYLNIGNAFYEQGETYKALQHWHIAASMAPDHPSVMINLATTYEALGNEQLAYNYYELYLKIQKGRPSLEYTEIQKRIYAKKRLALKKQQLGVRFQRIEKIRKATIAYMEALTLYPNLPKAYLNLGSICYKANKLQDAIRFWSNSARLDPDYPNTHCNIAVAYDRLRQYTYSYCYYSRFLEVQKKDTNDKKGNCEARRDKKTT